MDNFEQSDKMSDGLFVPNNHSRYEINWRPIDDTLKAKVSEVAKDDYGISDIADVTEVDEWEHNSNNFKVTFGPDRHSVLLRKNIRIKDPSSVSGFDHIFKHLDSNGVKVPQIIRTNKGEAFTENEGRIWTASEFFPGNHYSGTEEELKEVALGIRKLHGALKTLDKKIDSDIEFAWDIENITLVLDKVESLSVELEGLIARKKVLIIELAQKTVKERQDFPSNEMQIIHNDLHPHNTLFEAGRLQAIIDFDNLRQADVRIDIAQALHRFVRQFVIHCGDRDQSSIDTGVQIFLDNYFSDKSVDGDVINSLSNFMRENLFRKMSYDLRKIVEAPDAKAHEAEVKKFFMLIEETMPMEEAINTYAKEQEKAK